MITVVAIIALVVTVHRRNAATWVAARARWLRARRTAVPTGAAVDIAQGSIVCGVRTDTHEAITMIRVAGRPDSPTFLRTSAVSNTANLLPLDVLIGLLDQPGDLHLGIDVVSAGHRVRRGTGYPALYSTLLADRPAAGQRSTRLVVRLDIPESVAGLAYRRSIGTAAAAATERIINALFQVGVRASALGAAELDAALAELGAGLAAPPPPQPLTDDEPDRRRCSAGDVRRAGDRGCRPRGAGRTGEAGADPVGGGVAGHRRPPRSFEQLLLLAGGHHHRRAAPDVGAAHRSRRADAGAA